MAFDLYDRAPGTCPNCKHPCDEHGCHAPIANKPGEWGFEGGICNHPDAIRLSGLFDDEDEA